MLRRFGWIPDLPDVRDKVYLRSIQPTALPSKAMVPALPRISDQGQLGSCTGNATASACEAQLRAAGIDVDLSRLFAYYGGRRREGSVGSDAGAMIRDVIKGVVEDGLPSETTWPYDVSRFADSPSTAAMVEAARHRATAYHRCSSVWDIKDAIAKGQPVVIGFTVYDSFGSAGATGIYPQPSGGVRGGHAVCVVGYDDAANMPWGGPGALWIANSWGPRWGIPAPGAPTAGFFLMPYGVVQDPNLADDFWAVTVGGL